MTQVGPGPRPGTTSGADEPTLGQDFEGGRRDTGRSCPPPWPGRAAARAALPGPPDIRQPEPVPRPGGYLSDLPPPWQGVPRAGSWVHDGQVPAHQSSLLSIKSENSVLCVGSRGSVLSIASVGSVLSVGSIGSFLSAFSIGSFASVSSVLCAAADRSVLSWHTRKEILGGGRPDA